MISVFFFFFLMKKIYVSGCKLNFDFKITPRLEEREIFSKEMNSNSNIFYTRKLNKKKLIQRTRSYIHRI